MKAVIVGAGLAGLTAGVLLKRAGWQVEVFDTQEQPGGACQDQVRGGWHVHLDGPHVFHTNRQDVWNFMNEFTKFTDYKHKVVAQCCLSENLVPVPYSKATAKALNMSLEEPEIEMCFFHQYSKKMWGIEWKDLPPEVTSRVPKKRNNFDTNYFTDHYQGMPEFGYAHMFSQMVYEIGDLGVYLSVSPDEWKASKRPDLVVYTGSVDEYYDYSQGELPYRTLDIDHRVLKPTDELVTGHAVVNECNGVVRYTRVTDYTKFYKSVAKFWSGAADPNKIPISVEYPRKWVRGDKRFYPMHWGAGKAIYDKYDRITTIGPQTLFCGRLGRYQYMNMDAVVGDTMDRVASLLEG